MLSKGVEQYASNLVIEYVNLVSISEYHFIMDYKNVCVNKLFQGWLIREDGENCVRTHYDLPEFLIFQRAANDSSRSWINVDKLFFTGFQK